LWQDHPRFLQNSGITATIRLATIPM
jgi:hypothetical protein